MSAENRLSDDFDAVLHLLDRQLLDPDGRMLGKVDDLELVIGESGMEITGVLTGTTALLHRLGGRLGSSLVRSHARLRPSEPDRDRPWRIPMDLVDRVDTAVHIDRSRESILRHDREELRFGTLTGMVVKDRSGRRLGRVIDAHVEPTAGRLLITSLLVGPGGPGSYLGYERRREQGPWLIGALIRLWHRGTRSIDVADVTIDWEAREATVR